MFDKHVALLLCLSGLPCEWQVAEGGGVNQVHGPPRAEPCPCARCPEWSLCSRPSPPAGPLPQERSLSPPFGPLFEVLPLLWLHEGLVLSINAWRENIAKSLLEGQCLEVSPGQQDPKPLDAVRHQSSHPMARGLHLTGIPVPGQVVACSELPRGCPGWADPVAGVLLTSLRGNVPGGARAAWGGEGGSGTRVQGPWVSVLVAV